MILFSKVIKIFRIHCRSINKIKDISDEKSNEKEEEMKKLMEEMVEEDRTFLNFFLHLYNK